MFPVLSLAISCLSCCFWLRIQTLNVHFTAHDRTGFGDRSLSAQTAFDDKSEPLKFLLQCLLKLQKSRKDASLVYFLHSSPAGRIRRQDAESAALGVFSSTATAGQAGVSRQVNSDFQGWKKRLKHGTENILGARHMQAGKMETHQTKPGTSPT